MGLEEFLYLITCLTDHHASDPGRLEVKDWKLVYGVSILESIILLFEALCNTRTCFNLSNVNLTCYRII